MYACVCMYAWERESRIEYKNTYHNKVFVCLKGEASYNDRKYKLL